MSGLRGKQPVPVADTQGSSASPALSKVPRPARTTPSRPGGLTVHQDLTRPIKATAAGELDLAVLSLAVADKRLQAEARLLASPPGHRLGHRAHEFHATCLRPRPHSFVMIMPTEVAT